MPIFEYKVRDTSGKLVKGEMDAAGREALADRLSHLGYFIISIKGVTRFPTLEDILAPFVRVKTEELVMFTVQLASMIGAGISLPNSLKILIDQVENRRLKGIIEKIYDDIKGGSTFSDALGKHPGVFSTLFVNMIHSGETAGNLEVVLKRISTFIESEAELKQKVLTALYYPIVLTVFGVGVIILVITTLIPAFTRIFIEAGVPLPLPTKILFLTDLAIKAYWRHIIVGIVIAYLGLRWFGRTMQGKTVFDSIKIRMPIWGPLIRKVIIARMSRTLATLIASGVPMLQSLETLERTIDNEVMSNVIKNVSSSVSKGQTISDPIKDSGEFPPMVSQMIAVGEESGALEAMLNKIADLYEMTTDYSVRRLTALLEPIFLIIIGGMIGFIFASILLPIFRMVATLSH
ncbi:MAG: type II secretion system F family protein [Candidatus Saganbacteria bacterium]|nr:type II secretion system F family protein [Candidatus Saganbacteria bacterium]